MEVMVALVPLVRMLSGEFLGKDEERYLGDEGLGADMRKKKCPGHHELALSFPGRLFMIRRSGEGPLGK